MSATEPTLHMLCGKIAAGKSTLAAELVARDGAILLSEDAWLSALFGDQMSTGADFMRCSETLRSAIGPHVVALLGRGLSVVLDFAANTRDQRAWMRGLLDQAPVAHRMHVLEVPDAVCLARLKARNARGDHAFAASEELFVRFTRNFVPPAPEEGFTIVTHRQDG